MKTSILLTTSVVVLALTTTLFSACDLLNKADDINFDATLQKDIEVSDASTGTNVSYAKTIVIDAASDPDISTYINKIKGFTVNSIKYQVITYDGPDGATFSGTLAFGEASGGTPTLAATIDNLNFSTAFASGHMFELSYSKDDIDKIQNLLKADKAVKVLLQGSLSETPLYCIVTIYMDVVVNSKVL